MVSIRIQDLVDNETIKLFLKRIYLYISNLGENCFHRWSGYYSMAADDENNFHRQFFRTTTSNWLWNIITASSGRTDSQNAIGENKVGSTVWNPPLMAIPTQKLDGFYSY